MYCTQRLQLQQQCVAVPAVIRLEKNKFHGQHIVLHPERKNGITKLA
jgi:hypothetical protein